MTLLPVEHNPKCSDCNLCKNENLRVCVPGSGNDTADILIVSDFPRVREDKAGRPLVGQQGQFLRKRILVHAGIEEADVRFTHAVRCRTKKDKVPTIREIEKCRQYLEAEVSRIKPKVIVALGNVPLSSLMNHAYKNADKTGGKVSGITHWAGKHVWSREFGAWIVFTYAPGFVEADASQGNDYYYDEAVKHFELANKLANQKRHKPSRADSYVVSTIEQAHEVFSAVESAAVVAFDIETGGIGHAYKKYPIGFSVAYDEAFGYYFPWSFLKDDSRFKDRVYSFLSASPSDRELVMHNGAFELKVLWANKVPIDGRYFDTMLAANQVDENFPQGLKELTWLHTDFGGYELELDKYKREHKIKEDYSKIDYDILSKYGGLDAVATLRLRNRFRSIMKAEKSLPAFRKIVMPIQRVFSTAETNGLRLDVVRTKALGELLVEASKRFEKKFFDAIGREINLKSTKQLAALFFDELGLPPMKETKFGYSTDAQTLEFIVEKAKEKPKKYKYGYIADYLLKSRKFHKMKSTYVDQPLKALWPDNRVHTTYLLAGTVTGRPSSIQPNINNIPRDRLFRSLYTATPGRVLIEADLKQAELAFLAVESEEEFFLRAFREKRDLHIETAAFMFDVPVDEVTKDQRQIAKTINFGLIYGMSAKKLADTIKVPVDRAEGLMRLYFERLPAVERYMDNLRQHAVEFGYVDNLFGRRRRLPLARHEDKWTQLRAFRQATNSPIQGGAAWYAYIGIIRLMRAMEKEGMDSAIVHSVYDCVIVDATMAEKSKVQELILDSFETPVHVRGKEIRMSIDIESGERWGEDNGSDVLPMLEEAGLKSEYEKIEKESRKYAYG